MSILLTIIGIIAGIIILILIIALFVKKEYVIERQIDINQPKEKVFDYIKYIKHQDDYSVWNQIDPSMQKTYKGSDGTVGFAYAWDSTNKKAGKGEQEIKSITAGERIDMEIHFIKPFEGVSNAFMSATALSAGQTKVKWGIDGAMKYPMNFMMLFMNMENMLGNDIAKGLSNLKVILEK